jgi:hypothetical protein
VQDLTCFIMSPTLKSKPANPAPISERIQRGSRTTARHVRDGAETPNPPPHPPVMVDPSEELRLVAEVRAMAHPEDYVLGGQVDHQREEVVLVRGDFSQVVVPFAWFRAGQAEADFDDFTIVDSGETLRFGEYEWPVSAVLGQHDLRALAGT